MRWTARPQEAGGHVAGQLRTCPLVAAGAPGERMGTESCIPSRVHSLFAKDIIRGLAEGEGPPGRKPLLLSGGGTLQTELVISALLKILSNFW